MGAWVGLLPQAPPTQSIGEVANSYAKLGEIQQQRQLQQQQVQENAIKLQQQRQAQADSEALTQHLIEAGGDPNKALDAAQKAGNVSFGTLQGARTKIAEANEKAAQTDTAVAKLNQEKSAKVADYLTPVVQAKTDDEAAAAWSVGLQAAQSQGIDTSKLPQQYPGKSAASSLLAGAMLTGHYATISIDQQKAATEKLRETREQAKADQEAKEAPVKLAEADNKATTSGLDLAARTVPDLPAAPAVGPVDPAVQDKWTAWRDKLPDGTKKYVDETYSAAAADKVKKMGLTGYQETMAEARKARNDRAAEMPAKNTTELEELANNPNVDPDTRKMATDTLAMRAAKRGGISEAQYHQYNNQKEDFQAKEQQQWKMVGEYGDALNTKDGDSFYNPVTHKTETMDANVRKYLTGQYEGAHTAAVDLQQRSKAIRAKIGAGEYEGKAGSKVEAPAATPAASSKPSAPTPAKQAGAPPASLLKEGIISKFKGKSGAWTLQNGKVVNLEAGQ